MSHGGIKYQTRQSGKEQTLGAGLHHQKEKTDVVGSCGQNELEYRNRRAKQVMNWTLGGKRGRGRPRKNWPETIYEDLRGLELTWEDALDAAEDRDGWRKRIA